jgi:hypothetical protein
MQLALLHVASRTYIMPSRTWIQLHMDCLSVGHSSMPRCGQVAESEQQDMRLIALMDISALALGQRSIFLSLMEMYMSCTCHARLARYISA